MEASLLPVIGLLGTFVAAGCLETRRPQRAAAAPSVARWVANIGLAVVNYGLVGFLVQTWLTTEALGGLRIVSAPWPDGLLGLAAAFLALDLVRYSIHRLFHASAALWRLHALHHSDVDVDVSTTFRHHPLEFMLVAAMIAAAHALFAIPVVVAVAYALVAETLSVLGHAHLRWPPAFERALARVLLTPGFHAQHHSAAPQHRDRNFGGVLTLWDRLFGTYLAPDPAVLAGVRFGVGESPGAPRTERLVAPLSPAAGGRAGAR